MEGKTVKALHEEGYTYTHKYLDTWVKGTSEAPVTVTRECTADLAIEFTDGSIYVVNSCGCCGGASIEAINA